MLIGGLAPAAAQVTFRPDGKWRHLLTAGLNANRGNTESTALNLASDSVSATDSDKWSLTSQWLYAKERGTTTGDRIVISTQYNNDITRRRFAFVHASGQRDRPANLRNRMAVDAGMGLHLVKEGEEFWDAWAGLAVSQERYLQPVPEKGGDARRYTDSGFLFAQESNTRLSNSTVIKQKLAWMPSLRRGQHNRIEFDSRMAVAINEKINLSIGLGLRYNSHPGPNLQRLDTAIVSGLSLRLD